MGGGEGDAEEQEARREGEGGGMEVARGAVAEVARGAIAEVARGAEEKMATGAGIAEEAWRASEKPTTVTIVRWYTTPHSYTPTPIHSIGRLGLELPGVPGPLPGVLPGLPGPIPVADWQGLQCLPGPGPGLPPPMVGQPGELFPPSPPPLHSIYI